MLKTVTKIIILLAVALAFAKDPLEHFGIAVLEDIEAQQELRSRFNARGMPIIMVSNVRRGISLGDIIRFEDRVVLVDSDVLQTLKNTGVLSKIQNAPLTYLRARAASGVWSSRADQTQDNAKKAYTLGAQFLETLEEYFGAVPRSGQIALQFEGNDLVLVAPRSLLQALTFKKPAPRPTPVVAPPKPVEKKIGTPQIVSIPQTETFAGASYRYQVWAVDPEAPHKEISYTLASRLPRGLEWNSRTHTIEGISHRTGSYTIKVVATNQSRRTDEQEFTLVLKENQAPEISGHPFSPKDVGPAWFFKPHISDPDHLIEELKVEASGYPKELLFDSLRNQFVLRNPSQMPPDFFDMKVKVTDPLGKSTQRTFEVRAGTTTLQFVSSLPTHKYGLNQKVAYKPVATGSKTAIRYRVLDMEQKEVNWNQQYLVLNTSHPGSYSYIVEAFDSDGNIARQQIAYEVQPGVQDWQAVVLTNDHFTKVMNLRAYYLAGVGRYGIYQTTSPFNFPFLTAGINILGEKQAARGNKLFLEGGIKLWGGSKVIAGGGMVRLEGKYNTFNSNAMVYEYTFMAYANQGILVPDAKSFANNGFRDSTEKQCYDEIQKGSRPGIVHYREMKECIDGAKDILEGYEHRNNSLIFAEIKTWYPVGSGFWMGPALWYEDYINRNFSVQRLGLGVRHAANLYWSQYAAELLVGVTGNSDSPFGFRFQMHWSFGSEP